MANPKSFKDLNVEQVRAAAEYFGVDSTNSKATMLIELEEVGVDWNQYADAFIKEEESVTEATAPENVVLSEDVAPTVPVEPTKVVTVEEVVTAPRHQVLPQADYLIKMERENPSFEFGKYKFTDKNPYQIMPAADAQAILSQEDGFRQAFPAELQEYYS